MSLTGGPSSASIDYLISLFFGHSTSCGASSGVSDLFSLELGGKTAFSYTMGSQGTMWSDRSPSSSTPQLKFAYPKASDFPRQTQGSSCFSAEILNSDWDICDWFSDAIFWSTDSQLSTILLEEYWPGTSLFLCLFFTIKQSMVSMLISDNWVNFMAYLVELSG